MQENHRHDERIPISLDIVLESLSGKREVRISDLSMSGCFVDSIATVAAGETLHFNLRLSMGQSVEVYGEVVYVYPSIGFGLRFIDLTEEKRALLKQIIQEHGGQVSQPPYSAAEEKTHPD